MNSTLESSLSETQQALNEACSNINSFKWIQSCQLNEGFKYFSKTISDASGEFIRIHLICQSKRNRILHKKIKNHWSEGY